MNIIQVFLGGLMLIASVVDAQRIEISRQESSVNWIGKKLTGEHTGTLSFLNGGVVLGKRGLIGGSFEIDMNSITCTDIEDKKSNVRLIDHLKSDDFFAVRAYPVSRLEVTKVEHAQGNDYSVTGNLTIKGITHKITFPSTVSLNGNVVTITAQLTFDRSKYNIKFGSNTFFENLGDEMIYDDIELVAQLIARMPVKN